MSPYKSTTAMLVAGIALGFYQQSSWAASCCGGGGSTSLVLPKFSRSMLDVSLDYEQYDGFWDNDGNWKQDPPGSDLNQYRMNFGYAHRLSENWQASVSIPYAWNRNQYASLERNTDGLGDTTLSFWYESFEKITCVWDVVTWEDLLPAVYWGGALTVPTGTSPYDDVEDNFDITGRGAYRFDLSVLVEKTIYPWNASFNASYGKYLERSVNREYGTHVEPYDKQLGDRINATLSLGYTHFTDQMNSLTTTVSYTYLEEEESEIDGVTDPTSGFQKESIALALAWATADRNWITTVTWSHAPKSDDWGVNFPSTDILTVGLTHVLR